MNIGCWALDSGDFAQLVPIQNPHLNIIKFDFDVSHYLTSRNVDEFPVIVTTRPSYVVVFAPAKVDEVNRFLLTARRHVCCGSVKEG